MNSGENNPFEQIPSAPENPPVENSQNPVSESAQNPGEIRENAPEISVPERTETAENVSENPTNVENSGENIAETASEDSAKNANFQSEFAEMPEQEIRENPAETGEKPEIEIHWSAGESLEKSRGGKQNLLLILGCVVILAALVALAIFGILPIVTAATTGALIVVILIAMFVVAKKPVREIDYELTDKGITIDGVAHPFSEFRAFGVKQIGGIWELALIPVKRFGLGNTMFIHEDQGEQIVDALGSRLPMEEISDSFIDKISRKISV